jgi:hypothetical protein
MPTYTYVNKVTGETWEEFSTIATMEEKLEANRDLDVLCGLPHMGDPMRFGKISKRPDNHSHFRDVIKTIKSKHPHNTIDGSD